MSKNILLKRKIIFAVIILFIGTSLTPTMLGDIVENVSFLTTSESVKETSSINKGSLSGYVNNTLMNPIKGALVRVYFHETYEEDYTDSSGYYHVTNIPICFCFKNTTASKSGYTNEWIFLVIDENTTHDFVLTHSTGYNGSLSGYVNNNSMNPIEGARVRVYFHETYEEDYTDSSGYYNVNNIPICFCLKNCTVSKKGYKTEWILLAIDGNTTYDFVLTHTKHYISDLNKQQSIKNFYLQFLESFSLLERLWLPIFNRMLFS
ncbi:MAG: carboxypeptidase regulatory-like domain-containing protein [Promethearchaeota archaeon]|jgi:hypothetical protein